MAVHIIGMPIYHGCDKFGSNLGPDKFRELDVLSAIKSLGYDTRDLGNIEVADVSVEDKYKHHPCLKYYDVIIDANTKLAFKVYESISTGNFPVVLGGDHSLGIGSIAGVSKAVKNLGIVWIDAHGDLNTHDTTITGNIHGMPLAASIGKGPDKLVNLFEHRVKVKDENVVHIAGRDLDPGEIELIKNSKIKAFNMDEIRKYGIEKVVNNAINYLRSKVDAIHVSFDIDSIDLAYVPGTGTPVKDGLTIEEAKKTLEMFASSGLMVSLDFVELNPLLDYNDVTANISSELLTRIFENLVVPVNDQLKLG
ncbi:arginase [Clostridium sp. SYSU_GA19001]|uniref:arginase n=1 Tax=Clostridium caldaquaticum TaxID=2940653 RepID=UPI002076F2C2|nr:arginase [Clostridium caldaquaticum]MCM8709702.1 arginase [Clostridium caldaquaticum]